MTHGIMRKMRNRVHAAQGFDRALERGERIHQRAEGDEPQGQRFLYRPQIAGDQDVLVDGHGNHRDEHHDRMHDRQRDDPRRNRSADKMMHAHLAVEQSEPPKPQQGQTIGIDRFADDLGDEVIGSPDPQGRQPQAQDIMGEPPVYGCLLRAGMDVGYIGDGEQDRKPAERGEVIPARDIDMIDVAPGRRRQERDDEEGPRYGEQDVDLPGYLQPLLTVGPAPEATPIFQSIAPTTGRRAKRSGVWKILGATHIATAMPVIESQP